MASHVLPISNVCYTCFDGSLFQKIKEIMEAVTIPVMAKVRIGHFVEAQILQELGVDFIDESEGVTFNH